MADYNVMFLTGIANDLFAKIESGLEEYLPEYFKEDGKTIVSFFDDREDSWWYVNLWFSSNKTPFPELINWGQVTDYEIGIDSALFLEPIRKTGIKIDWAFPVDKKNKHIGSKVLEEGYNGSYLEFKRIILGVIPKLKNSSRKPRNSKAAPQKATTRIYWHHFYNVKQLRAKVESHARNGSKRTTMWNAQLDRKHRTMNQAFATLERMIERYQRADRTGFIDNECGDRSMAANGEGFELINELALDINLCYKFVKKQKMDVSQAEIVSSEKWSTEIEMSRGYPRSKDNSLMKKPRKLTAVDELEIYPVLAKFNADIMVQQK